MRYILIDIMYKFGSKTWVLLSYDNKTCATYKISCGTIDEQGSIVNNGSALYGDVLSNLLEINTNNINFSSLFKSSFNQILDTTKSYCEYRLKNIDVIDKIVVEEITKAKVFELML